MIDYKNQLSSINNSTILENVPDGAVGYILFNIFQETKYKFITYAVKSNTEIEFIKNEIKFYDENIEIIEFPEWNTIPYDVASPNIDIQLKRMESLYNLSQFKSCLVDKKVLFLISKKSLLQKVINLEDFTRLVLKLEVGQNISIDNIADRLESNCYNETDTAISIGDYAINNGKIDIVTFRNLSFRITIKNNIVKELKYYNPVTQ
ncbi:MAG: hypothetical protein GX638_03380, partial [Crenarchaeota archaeon]|nr:hypothetical protein [Thermoproteota archaeon]